MNLTCPHCGQRPERWLPVEPYWGLPAVADLLNTTPGYLRKWLCTDPYLSSLPKLYRKDRTHQLHRMLPQSLVYKMLAWRARKYL
jgi:hypothetical protein